MHRPCSMTTCVLTQAVCSNRLTWWLLPLHGFHSSENLTLAYMALCEPGLGSVNSLRGNVFYLVLG